MAEGPNHKKAIAIFLKRMTREMSHQAKTGSKLSGFKDSETIVQGHTNPLPSVSRMNNVSTTFRKIFLQQVHRA